MLLDLTPLSRGLPAASSKPIRCAVPCVFVVVFCVVCCVVCCVGYCVGYSLLLSGHTFSLSLARLVRCLSLPASRSLCLPLSLSRCCMYVLSVFLCLPLLSPSLYFSLERCARALPACFEPILFLSFSLFLCLSLSSSQISEAGARADSQARRASSTEHPTATAVSSTPAPARGREPRPPILQARFFEARVVYLQRFTMEQVGKGVDVMHRSIDHLSRRLRRLRRFRVLFCPCIYLCYLDCVSSLFTPTPCGKDF